MLERSREPYLYHEFPDFVVLALDTKDVRYGRSTIPMVSILEKCAQGKCPSDPKAQQTGFLAVERVQATQ